MTEQHETTKISEPITESMPEPADAAAEKKQLLIFLLVAFGVTYAMGLLTWYGSTVSAEMSTFPNAQMYYPAVGVMLAYLITRWKDALLPRWFYLCFIIVTVPMILCAVLSVFQKDQQLSLNGQSISLWSMLSQYIMIGGTILCWIILLLSGKKRRAAYGLGFRQWKTSVLCVLLFLVLYFGRAAIIYIIGGQADIVLAILKDPDTWSYLLLLTPLNFFLAFAPFLGEEYGWRYYLQPILQKRFGLRGGVLILGVAWGLWHIFLDFFFYTTPDKGMIMTLSQIITCVTLGIFFAWAYKKTNNFWVPVILHFLNNNLSVVVANNYSAEIVQNQDVTWSMLPLQLIVNGILFGLFLLAREFRQNDSVENDSK